LITVHQLSTNIKRQTSVFDVEEEDGVQDGECPFVVHGITGENYST